TDAGSEPQARRGRGAKIPDTANPSGVPARNANRLTGLHLQRKLYCLEEEHDRPRVENRRRLRGWNRIGAGLLGVLDMPFYDYKCKKCGNVFEELVPSSATPDRDVECPHCGAHQAKRLLAAPSIGTGKSGKSGPAPGCSNTSSPFS
ncbi:MAG: hypothetical protein GF355_09395, partial [Candidatus Eisenbacteria bacterium]|nr:hypothetical protein [Candidatus Eisenbacteria bacterium]